MTEVATSHLLTVNRDRLAEYAQWLLDNKRHLGRKELAQDQEGICGFCLQSAAIEPYYLVRAQDIAGRLQQLGDSARTVKDVVYLGLGKNCLSKGGCFHLYLVGGYDSSLCYRQPEGVWKVIGEVDRECMVRYVAARLNEVTRSAGISYWGPDLVQNRIPPMAGGFSEMLSLLGEAAAHDSMEDPVTLGRMLNLSHKARVQGTWDTFEMAADRTALLEGRYRRNKALLSAYLLLPGNVQLLGRIQGSEDCLAVLAQHECWDIVPDDFPAKQRHLSQAKLASLYETKKP